MEPQASFSLTAIRVGRIVRPHRLGIAFKRAASALTVATAGLISIPAHAADGCLVMLCLAAPSWSSIAQCVDPVRQVLRDLARGRPFPSCPTSGAGDTASHQWSNAPAFCPVQYTHSYESESGTVYSCEYAGAIEVDIDGALWARTWWNPLGDSVTEFAPVAKAHMRGWSTRFDDEYARWLAAQVPPPSPCATC